MVPNACKVRTLVEVEHSHSSSACYEHGIGLLTPGVVNVSKAVGVLEDSFPSAQKDPIYSSSKREGLCSHKYRLPLIDTLAGTVLAGRPEL